MSHEPGRRPADTAPPLDSEAVERIRALLGLAVKRRPDMPLGIRSRKAAA